MSKNKENVLLKRRSTGMETVMSAELYEKNKESITAEGWRLVDNVVDVSSQLEEVTDKEPKKEPAKKEAKSASKAKKKEGGK